MSTERDPFERLDALALPQGITSWAETRAHPSTQDRRRTLEGAREPTSLHAHARGALAYRASEGLKTAINTALALEMPLLLAGKPGTGKTQAAWFIAAMFGLDEPFRVTVRSNSTRRDLLYDFDAVGDFRDVQELALPQREAKPLSRARHIRPRALWQGIAATDPCVVLIDEIDKAPRDLPNDLLEVLDDFEFDVPELDRCDATEVHTIGPELAEQHGRWVVRGDPKRRRPIVVITTNAERQLPEPFLRRCVFHYIKLDRELVLAAYASRRHAPELAPLCDEPEVVERAATAFMDLAENDRLKKPPSVAEFLAWLRLLALVPGKQADLQNPAAGLPFLTSLLKVHEDLVEVGYAGA